MKRAGKYIAFLFLLSSVEVNAQISITTLGIPGMFTETFSSINTGSYSDGTTYTWTDNTTLTGWYMRDTDAPNSEFNFHNVLATGNAVDNAGKLTVFNMGGDKSVGFRASGTHDHLWWGLRLQNNTGSTVSSLFITSYIEQWTIAENVNSASCTPYCANIIKIQYRTNAGAITDLTSGAYTDAGLTATPMHSCTLAVCTTNTAQRVILDGNLSSNKVLISGCLNVTLNNTNEIMLKWVDDDDGANDHHQQIDDVTIRMYDVACATVLPVELLDFSARYIEGNGVLRWITASESNLRGYVVEYSDNGSDFLEVGEVKANNLNSVQAYELVHPNPPKGLNYYRLKIYDLDGSFEYSGIKVINTNGDQIQIMAWTNNSSLMVEVEEGSHFTSLDVFTMEGKLVLSQSIEEGVNAYNVGQLEKGVYLIRAQGKYGSETRKIFVR